MLALTTITASLKKEMASFATDVAQGNLVHSNGLLSKKLAGRDKNELIKDNETLRSVLRRLEAELKTAINERDSSREQLAQSTLIELFIV